MNEYYEIKLSKAKAKKIVKISLIFIGFLAVVSLPSILTLLFHTAFWGCGSDEYCGWMVHRNGADDWSVYCLAMDRDGMRDMPQDKKVFGVLSPAVGWLDVHLHKIDIWR